VAATRRPFNLSADGLLGRGEKSKENLEGKKNKKSYRKEKRGNPGSHFRRVDKRELFRKVKEE